MNMWYVNTLEKLLVGKLCVINEIWKGMQLRVEFARIESIVPSGDSFMIVTDNGTYTGFHNSNIIISRNDRSVTIVFNDPIMLVTQRKFTVINEAIIGHKKYANYENIEVSQEWFLAEEHQFANQH